MSTSATFLHPREATATTADKSNVITIVTWTTLVLTVLVFLARQCIKLAISRKITVDDLLILVATVFAVGLSVTLLILASDGLGVLGVLTFKRANSIMKGVYASDFLYISTLGFAKLSLLFSFYTVHHQRGQRNFVLAIGIFILAWTVASLGAVAFQCGLPRPWEMLTLHCFNLGIFWVVYCIIDMTSDVAIIMLSVNLVAYLKVKMSRKVAVIACFMPRILVIGAALARLVYLYPISPHKNPAFNLWIPMVCTQIQASLSIITACIPFVRPFFGTTESSIRRFSQARSKRYTSQEESCGCCSAGYLRGHNTPHAPSGDTSPCTNSRSGRTPEFSPRIPSPAPLSPLTTPRFNTPPNTTRNGAQTPSETGLRLEIPSGTATPNHLMSPQSASSHALSPEPLLESSQLEDSPTLPATEIQKPPTGGDQIRPPRPRRFSLFPSPKQSPISPPRARPTVLIPPAIVERSQPNPPDASTPQPLMFPPRPSSSLERIAYDDPIRTIPMAVTTSSAVPAPPPVPHSSIPSYYVKTPPASHKSVLSSSPSVPSYYMRTPPTSQPPSLPPSIHAHDVPPPPAIPTSPQHWRNRRILTPQNSSRLDQMSPVSPVTPPTPRTFWRDSSSASAVTPRSPDGFEDASRMPAIQDTRSSPRIVVQRFP